MENTKDINNIINLTCRLIGLCEGFDQTSKSALISAKFRVLFVINQEKKISPSLLKEKVSLAKSNLALLCKKLIEEKLIISSKDNFDTRVIFYSLTEEGERVLQDMLSKMKFNFVNEIAYKNNFNEIMSLVAKLNQLLK